MFAWRVATGYTANALSVSAFVFSASSKRASILSFSRDRASISLSISLISALQVVPKIGRQAHVVRVVDPMRRITLSKPSLSLNRSLPRVYLLGLHFASATFSKQYPTYISSLFILQIICRNQKRAYYWVLLWYVVFGDIREQTDFIPNTYR